jgi:phosphoglycerate dehydrogenase-like enzyme
MLNAIIVGTDEVRDSVYDASARHRIQVHCRLLDEHGCTLEALRDGPAWLADVEVIFGTWSLPLMDAALLDRMPRLRAIFYAAGTVRYFTTDALWDRKIAVCSAASANAIPVAEYTFAQIILGLKHTYHLSQAYCGGAADYHQLRNRVFGAFQSTVGLISYGAIARLVRRLLRTLDVQVKVYDPFLTAEEARAEQLTLCSLDEIFATCHAVSLHTPWLPETEGMIRGRHFRSLMTNAVFINTARGAVINEPEMVEVLQHRPDLLAVIDVTYPEPPAKESPLYRLPNVLLTPHIAGSMGAERARMAHFMADELERFVRREPLHYSLTRERVARMA